MKKVLLIVAMLLVVSPVMATVTITATQEGTYGTPDGNRAATLRITYSSTDVNVRAFALDINIDGGCNFWNIRDFNVGENNSTKQGYGIFPGRFRAFVNPANPNWIDTNYNPLAAWNDPGSSLTGIGYGIIIAELGYLGATDANMPAKSGTLFRIDVNGYAARDANLTIAADTMRAGVVAKDTNATTTATNLPVTSKVIFRSCTTPLNEVTQTQSAALAAWGGQGFTNIQGVGVVNCAQLGLVITNDQNCINAGDQLNYTYGIAPTEPNVIGMTRAQAVTTLTNAGFTVGASSTDVNGWGGPNNVTTVGNVYAQSPVPGTQACNQTVVLSVVSYPIKATGSLYANWVTSGKPQCWAYPRQCRGDADGKKQGNYWVGTNDLAIYKTASNKNPITAVGGHCADFDHAKQGNYWVGTNDLAVYKTYSNKAESLVPLCGNTSTTADVNFWYWCLPSGGTCPTSPAGQVCAPALTCPNTP